MKWFEKKVGNKTHYIHKTEIKKYGSYLCIKLITNNYTAETNAAVGIDDVSEYDEVTENKTINRLLLNHDKYFIKALFNF